MERESEQNGVTANNESGEVGQSQKRKMQGKKIAEKKDLEKIR